MTTYQLAGRVGLCLCVAAGTGAAGPSQIGERLRGRIGLVDNPVEDESLGTRRISGIDVVGRRITDTVPAGVLGNDRSVRIVDERWESPELKLLIYSRHEDPFGVIEYTVTGLSRTEPPSELFVVPEDYELVRLDEKDWIALEYGDPTRGSKVLAAGRR